MTQLTTNPKNQEPTNWLSRPLLTVMTLDWEKITYIVFIVLAIITRFWDLGSRVMSHDESLHTQFSYQFYNGEGYSHTPLMHGPFLFHITAVSYWLFGASDFSARIPVALFGVVLVALPYLFRHWIGRVGALFMSFIFLISPYVTYYSRYIRHDVYVIMWALIIFLATWYYIRTREEKYLWWFAAGNALMFATKEVSFIYVAIFGSFIVIRLLVQMFTSDWFWKSLPTLRTAIFVTLTGIVLAGGGYMWERSGEANEGETAVTPTTDTFAADPNEEVATNTEPLENTIAPWMQIGGILLFSAGLFLAGHTMREGLDQYPVFDLIILYTTLILPSASPILTTIAGWNPRDYNFVPCTLAGQETMTPLGLFYERFTTGECWNLFFDSGAFHSGLFVVLTLIIALLVGLWWQPRKWLIAALFFHIIFAILYTSVFTNWSGWASGTIGSLGYWLEQQDVKRGSQPDHYYFFVLTIYEFLPVIFSTLAIRLWLKKQQISGTVGYWINIFLIALVSGSLVNWVYNTMYVEAKNLEALVQGANDLLVESFVPAIALVGVILGIGLIVYLVYQLPKLKQVHEVETISELSDWTELVGFIPNVIWWLLLTWIAYSWAGEKMPWLSIHFVIPMGVLVGWYFNELLRDIQASEFFSRESLTLFGIATLGIVAVVLAFGPWWLGQVRLGGDDLNNLRGLGRAIGSLVVAGGLIYGWFQLRPRISDHLARPILLLSVFGLLSLLTIRATYMSSFVNADNATEYMVYAHGAPATKEVVMSQLEELSVRLHGDKSIKVAFDSDVSWPFTWYLRDYPNRVFFGESPNNSLTDSPVIIVGNKNWTKVEPFLGQLYEERVYTFVWWPMEEYRQFSWNSVFGNPNDPKETRLGVLGNAEVRTAVWDIFFYRDYKKYGDVFGGNYRLGQWPLRHDLKMYIRKDVLAGLWDYGIGAVNAEGLKDPYEAGEFAPSPVMVLNEAGAPGSSVGQFTSPRNLAVGADGRIYIADSGNHRIQVYATDGSFVTGWGTFGNALGQFNEPWGIAVDDEFVYVADTWNHRIQKFDLNGEFVNSFGQSGNEQLGQFFGPRSVTLLPDNRLLVTDTGNHRMQLLTRDGEFLRPIAEFGSQLGQFNEPVGIATGPDGSVYVADTWNGRIQHFFPELLPINEWRVFAWEGQSIVNKPYVAVDSANRIYVTDPEGYRVLIFDQAGEYLGRFGSFGQDSNSFGLPNGIAVDAQDNIYIADADNHRILKFSALFGAPIPLELEEEVPSEPAEGVLDEEDTTSDEEDTTSDEDGETLPIDEPSEED